MCLDAESAPRAACLPYSNQCRQGRLVVSPLPVNIDTIISDGDDCEMMRFCAWFLALRRRPTIPASCPRRSVYIGAISSRHAARAFRRSLLINGVMSGRSRVPNLDAVPGFLPYRTQQMKRTYENAISIIDSRRRGGRPKSTASSTSPAKAMPIISGTPDLRGTPSIVGMSEWLHMIGHSGEDINALNVIHIAGTKGKGSTCAFTESMLRAHGSRTGFPRKTGLYSSPHLMRPEERIRINSEPLAPELLAKYFFEVYDRLPQLAVEYDPSKDRIESGPRYLQLWALLAFHTFIRENVDVAILETHNGGEYDATNVVTNPIVTAVTTLGMDHIEMLGPSIENIAWHKSGIYKPGAVALSTIQESAPGQVLAERAAAKGEKLRTVGIDPCLPKESLTLKPTIQRKNASLTAAISRAYLERTARNNPVDYQLTSADIAEGVEQFSWPGRFQVVVDGKCTWFLDAAHNDMSVAIAARWFSESGQAMQQHDRTTVRILIFSHINELRDTATLLENLAIALKESGSRIAHVVFSTYDESKERQARKRAESPELFHQTWRQILPDTHVWDEPTIQGAMNRARDLSKNGVDVQTLITGSQHLVGPALRVLEARGVKI